MQNMEETQVRSLCWEGLELEMAPHCCILVWKAGWIGIGQTHTRACTHAHAHTRTHLLMVVLVQCWGFIQGTLAWALRFWCWWRKKWFISIMGLLSGVCASPVALVVKNPPTKVGGVRDAGSVCGFRWFPGGGRGIPLQCSCLENPTDIGVWWDTAHSVTHNWTWLKWLSTSACMALFQMLGTHEFNTVNRDLCS